MTDPLEYRARIKAKGCDTTGVTEDVAAAMFRNLGGHTVAIIEVKHDAVTTDAEGNHIVSLKITQVEPAKDERTETALREMMRAMYRTRPAVQGQEVLQGITGGLTVEDATAQATALIERDDDGAPDSIWTGDETEEADETPAVPDEDAEVVPGPWPGDPEFKAANP